MMTSAELIPAAILKRKAVVYVRQSTQSQVMINLESKRRQYDLVHVARQRGFVDVEIIDDDIGRSASGTVARPGFDRLVAWLCAGKVGAVLCFDASRLARNGRDWHHLLELCGLAVGAAVDPFKHIAKLRRRDGNDAVNRRRPYEPATLQALRIQRHPQPVVPEDLQEIAPLAAEDVEIASVRIGKHAA